MKQAELNPRFQKGGIDMEKKSKIISLTLVLIIAASVILMGGCGKKAETEATKTGESKQSTTTEQEGSGIKEETKTFKTGDKAVMKESEITVVEVAAVTNLALPVANRRLSTGEAGEGQESSNPPATGNEFLLIVFKQKNIGSKVINMVTPAEIKLEYTNGKEYTEVTTNGHGGIFNALPLNPAQEKQVTAVYEVPQGQTGLVLTYEPFGETLVKFEIR